MTTTPEPSSSEPPASGSPPSTGGNPDATPGPDPTQEATQEAAQEAADTPRGTATDTDAATAAAEASTLAAREMKDARIAARVDRAHKWVAEHLLTVLLAGLGVAGLLAWSNYVLQQRILHEKLERIRVDCVEHNREINDIRMSWQKWIDLGIPAPGRDDQIAAFELYINATFTLQVCK